MNKTIIKAPCVFLETLETLIIEMTAQNCNLRCKHCYIDFKEKKIKDFIPFDKVKVALSSPALKSGTISLRVSIENI